MANSTHVTIQNARNGGEWITDTSPHTRDTTTTPSCWAVIQVITATVFTTLTGSIRGSPSTTSVPAGTVLEGKFTTITLASGVIVAYDNES